MVPALVPAVKRSLMAKPITSVLLQKSTRSFQHLAATNANSLTTPSSIIQNFRNNPKKPGSPGLSIKNQAGPAALHRNPCHNSCVLIRRVGLTRTVPCSRAVSDFDRLHRATRGTTPPFNLPDAYPGSLRKSSLRCLGAQQSVLP